MCFDHLTEALIQGKQDEDNDDLYRSDLNFFYKIHANRFWLYFHIVHAKTRIQEIDFENLTYLPLLYNVFHPIDPMVGKVTKSRTSPQTKPTQDVGVYPLHIRWDQDLCIFDEFEVH